jgi:4-hydroxy-tetrahydrodipicolinate synthase
MIKGSIVALITPFNENNTINFNKLFELIEYQYICGTDALLILGTTSESSTLSDYEKDQIVNFVIRQNDKRMKIIVNNIYLCMIG